VVAAAAVDVAAVVAVAAVTAVAVAAGCCRLRYRRHTDFQQTILTLIYLQLPGNSSFVDCSNGSNCVLSVSLCYDE
jgi:hypothetical protein